MKKSDDGNVTFLGNAKSIETKFGAIVKGGFSKEDLDYMSENLNESGWFNWQLKTSKAGAPYMVEDTYKGSGSQATAAKLPIVDEDPFL